MEEKIRSHSDSQKRINLKKQILSFLLKFLISSLLILLLLRKIHFLEILISIQKISCVTFILVIVLDLLALLIAAYKWKILVSGYGFTRILLVSMIGRFYSLVLPGQLPGEAAKAYYLGKGQEDKMKVAASVIMDKLSGIVGLLFVGVVSLVFTSQNVPRSIIFSLTIVLAMSIMFLVVIRIRFITSLFEKMLTWAGIKFRYLCKISAHSIVLIDEIKIYMDRPYLLLGNFILACIYQLAGVLMVFIIARNLGIQVEYVDFCWIFAVVSIALLLPVTIGGLGLREGAFLGLLGWMNVLPDKAMALSLSFFGVQILEALAGGILALLKLGKET